MSKIDLDSLPYRPCVGIALFNKKGQLWLGHRAGKPETLPEKDEVSYAWQMPQGGIDEGEEPLVAALRELHEETNVSSVDLLSEAPEWFSYDLDRSIIQKGWRGKYRGQTQKWFAFLFVGDDAEIDVLNPGAGQFEAEFSQWRWGDLSEAPELIVPFKRDVYEQVVDAFKGVSDQLKLGM